MMNLIEEERLKWNLGKKWKSKEELNYLDRSNLKENKKKSEKHKKKKDN